MVSDALLDATLQGLGGGETPIFPQHIFQCKQGINQAEGEANYDLFLKAIECSSRRLYPNFVNVDATFNLAHYNPDDPNTIIATMGCRTGRSPIGLGEIIRVAKAICPLTRLIWCGLVLTMASLKQTSLAGYEAILSAVGSLYDGCTRGIDSPL